MSYNAFISYSHAADGLLAPRVQSGLQRFAKGMFQRRAIRVFRDESSLSANPHLWSSITDALDASEWFVLLLSPDAASSPWVNDEITYWLQHKDKDRILPVVTEGEFGPDILPPALTFDDEPRWVDLRFARTDEQLDLKNPTFSAAIADIASAVRGIPKDDLESEEVRQHRRTVRTAWAAATALTALAIIASLLARSAAEERDIALANTRVAQGLEALDEDPELAALLGLEAVRMTDPPLREAIDLLHASLQTFAIDHVGGFPDGVGQAQSTAMDLSPDGDSIAVTTDGEVIHILDASTLELTHSVGDGSMDPVGGLTGFPDLSISPDGRWIASVDPFGSVRVRDVSTGVDVFRSEPLTADPDTAGSALFSPRGDRLVAGGSIFMDGSLSYSIYETSNWSLIAEIQTGGTNVSGLTITNDGSYLVTGSWAFPPLNLAVIRVFDLESGSEVAERVVDASVSGIAVSPDNSMIAVGDLSGTITLREFENLEPIRFLFGHSAGLDGLRFNDDSSQLISSGNGRLILWDVASGKALKDVGPVGAGVRVSADWTRAYTVGDSRVESLPIGNATLGELLSLDDTGRVAAMDISPDGSRLAALTAVSDDVLLRVWELETGSILFEVVGLSKFSQGVSFSPDGSQIIVQQAGESADDLLDAVAGAVISVDAQTGVLVDMLEDSAVYERYAFDAASSGDVVVVGGVQTDSLNGKLPTGSSRLYRATDWSLISEQRHALMVGAVAIDASGERIATAGCGGEALVEIRTSSGEPLGSYQHFGCMLALDISRDGSLVASGSLDGGLKVWDVDRERILHDLEIAGPQHLQFNHDATLVAASTADGLVDVFRVDDGTKLASLRVSDQSVTWVRWLPGSTNRLYAGGEGEQIRGFAIEAEALIELVRERITRTFTEPECANYGLDPCPTLAEIQSR